MPYRNITALPVYRTAMNLCFISREIVSYLTHNKDLLQLYKSNSFRDSIADAILTDAILIPQKIAVAENSSCHTTRNSTLLHIQIMIQNILSYCRGLEHDGVKEKEYINLLREELKIFRKNYKQWKRSF